MHGQAFVQPQRQRQVRQREMDHFVRDHLFELGLVASHRHEMREAAVDVHADRGIEPGLVRVGPGDISEVVVVAVELDQRRSALGESGQTLEEPAHLAAGVGHDPAGAPRRSR